VGDAQEILEEEVISPQKEVVPSGALVREVLDARLREMAAERDKLRDGLEEKVRGVCRERDALSQELGDLKAVSADEVGKYAKILADVWTHPAAVPRERLFVDDPVFARLEVEPELCPLLAHPLVQRLNHIKQLAFAYLIYPSATHSRLSHCLGVSKLAEMALNGMLDRGVVYTSEGVEPITLKLPDRRRLVLKAKVAAMLHDVGHGPFGHALDRFVGCYYQPQKEITHADKEFSRRYIKTFLAERLPEGVEAEEVALMVSSTKEEADLKGWDCLIAQLVNSTLDLDRMDYLTRDAHMTGLAMQKSMVSELISGMRPFKKEEKILLTYDRSSLPHFDPFLYTREMMFLNCYDHPRKAAAERIFTRLVAGFISRHNIPVEQVMMLTDEQTLALLTLDSVSQEESFNLLLALLQNQEYELVVEKDVRDVHDWSRARDKGRGREAYVEMPGRLEREIAERSELGTDKAWQVLVVVPAQEVFIPLEIGTPILFEESGGYKPLKLSHVFPRLEVPLKKLIEVRNRIRVFADLRLETALRRKIEEVAEGILEP
jgi:HD superfamily phosphohydrolase